ncbi:unnamed protein product [Effrenium voratum]|uniref:Uncharacterized protein n=1 Tax=Effrenium voratum TaxID=2562239 RepID=A0AA36NIC8_9DINO|nr:unnamed protein product [Effrenium voratum]
MADLDLEIFHDRNFQAVAAQDMKLKDFTKTVDLHVPGYTEKKRLLDGLKDFAGKVEAAENKLYMVKAVGKVKGKMESEEHELINKYHSPDLKEKVQTLSASVQELIDQGRLTVEERPALQEQLAARRASAKAQEKAKLVERLELMLVSVGKAQGIAHPVAQLEDFYAPCQELKSIERLEKAPEKNLSDYDRNRIKKKSTLQDDVRRLENKSRMWFETHEDFQRRLQKALIELEKQKAEQAKQEAREAEERKRREEEEALERKRQALKEAEERKAAELEAKLEAKRQEAALKPQKAAPQAKKKEKVQRTKLDPHEFFQPPPREEEEEVEAAEEVEEVEEVEESQPKAEAGPTTPPEAKKEVPKVVATPEPVKKVPKPPKVVESKWGKVDGAEVELPEELAGPSLQESVKEAVSAAPTAPTKTAPPAPKKKEKKKFTKLGVSDLGFDANNPNYR